MPSLTIPSNVPCQHLWASSKLKPDNTYHSDIWECSGCGIDVVHNKTFDGHVNGWRPLDGSALPVIKAPSPYSLHDSPLCTPGVPIAGETPGMWGGGHTFTPPSFKVKIDRLSPFIRIPNRLVQSIQFRKVAT